MKPFPLDPYPPGKEPDWPDWWEPEEEDWEE